MYINICQHCNKKWHSSHPGKFCNSTCNHLFKKREIRKFIDLTCQCLECKCDFIAHRQGVKFCSVRCNNANWFKNNRSKHNFKEAKRRAQKIKATPKWLTKEHWEQIKKIYDTCPEGYHVDHIMPLQGENSSGLHVPWNLQHLPANVNCSKGNRV